MGFLNDLIRKIDQLDFEQIAEDAIVNTEEDLAQAQREQMLHGKKADGSPLGYYLNQHYADLKNDMNPLPGIGVVDLKYTGSFHKGIYATVIGDQVVIESSDPKTDELTEKYGDDVFGVGNEFRSEYIESSLKPSFKNQIKAKVNLPFSNE